MPAGTSLRQCYFWQVLNGVGVDWGQSKVCKDRQLLHPKLKLAQDFRKARRTGKRLGANCDRELEAWFGVRPQLENVATDPAETPSDRFMAAMRAAASTAVTDRTAEPMLAHLTTCTELNKTEVLGALKLMSTARRVNKSGRDSIVIAMLRLGEASLDMHLPAFEDAEPLHSGQLLRQDSLMASFFGVAGLALLP